jgi:FtsH-binding integral membrane protein
MNQALWRGIRAGVIGAVIGLIATYVVNLFIPTTNFRWSLIAVCAATFCAALGGYMAGQRQMRLRS